MEDANYYGPRNILSLGKSTDYESILKMVDMNTFEYWRIEQSLIIFLNVLRRMVQAICIQFIQTSSYII